MTFGAPPSALEPGSVLAGKYRIERVLGQGGMGIVAAAYHVQLEQRVALKLMLPHAMQSSEAVTRFLREARAAARISSEHVARVYDVGALETGEPYIAMEYLEGSDIARLLASQGRLPPDEAIDYLLQACEALAEAHHAGIVHRDLKPGNLFLVERIDGQRLVKVLDFGISKVTGGSAAQSDPMTRTSALMGSPLYMSPEQMTSSKGVDARSDIWALGVVFYEMLSGFPPFNGETLPQVCAMVMSEAAPPLTERAPGLHPTLYSVVHRCLEKQPGARFQNVAELAQALEPMATPRGRQSVERILRILNVTSPGVSLAPAISAAAPQAGTNASWGETSPPVAPSRGLPLVLGGVALLAVVAAAGAWAALRSQPEPDPSLSAAALAPDAPAASLAASAQPPPAVIEAPSVAPATPSAASAVTSTQPAAPSSPQRVAPAARVPAAKAAPAAPTPAPTNAAAPAAPASPKVTAAPAKSAAPATPASVPARSRL